MAEVSNLYAKMAEVGREVAYVQKAGKNKGVGYSYASAEQVLGKVNESLFGRGIAVNTGAKLLRLDVYPDVTDKAGKPLQVATVEISAVFTDGSRDPSGNLQTVAASGIGSGGDYGDKAVMKAFTAAHKYLYAGLFCISWGDDPEADSKMDTDAGEAKTPESKGTTKAKPVDTTEYPGHAVLEALAEEMKAANLKGLDKLPPADYASLVEGWKQRIVACKPSSTEAKYRETVKLYKSFVGEKTNG